MAARKAANSSFCSQDSCKANYVIVAPDVYGCASVVNRGHAVCTNKLRVPRHLIESKLLEEVKKDLFTPEGIELFYKEVTRLLIERQRASKRDKGHVAKALAETDQHIENVLNAIKAGIVTASTKQELEKLEAQRAIFARRCNEGEAKIVSMLPRAKERFQALVQQLEKVTLDHVSVVRPILRSVMGKDIFLYPTAEGYLEDELQGDYAGLLNLAVGCGKMEMVAGEGFEPSTFGL
jgi:site-specific DNA recombinase